MNNSTLKLQSHCVYDTRYHLILTTGGRKKLLTPKSLARFEQLAHERAEAWEGELLHLEGGADYVHLTLVLPPKVSIATFAGALKTGSSRRLRNEFPALARRKQLWSDRYLVLGDSGTSPAATITGYLDGSEAITNSRAAGAQPASVALDHLSATAETFLRERPDDASLVVAAAIEAAALQYNNRDANGNGGRAEPVEALGSVDDAPNDLIDASEAARRLGISQGSVYYWVKRGKLIAWPTDGRGALAIPAEQITDDGQVLDGIPAALEAAGDARTAWSRLTQPLRGNGKARSLLSRLQAGEVDEVVRRVAAA